MISIIIPVYNAEKNIINLLEKIDLQTFKGFEVIIVDDGSTDRSAILINENISKYSYPIKLINQENSGPAKARNLGVECSKGDIIVFLDSDCLPPENWLNEMLEPLKEKCIAGSSCGYQVKNKEFLIARYIDYEIARRHEKLLSRNIDSIGSYSAAYGKDIFLKAGGFSTIYRNASGEDFDLAFNIKNMGYNFFFTKKTFVFHYHPEKLKKFLKQQYLRGYWRVKLYQRNSKKIYHGDSYTGFEPQIQFLLSVCAITSIPLCIFYPQLIIFGPALVVSNLPLGLWCYRKEKKFLILAPLIASMRSLAGTIGAIAYFIKW